MAKQFRFMVRVWLLDGTRSFPNGHILASYSVFTKFMDIAPESSLWKIEVDLKIVGKWTASMCIYDHSSTYLKEPNRTGLNFISKAIDVKQRMARTI